MKSKAIKRYSFKSIERIFDSRELSLKHIITALNCNNTLTALNLTNCGTTPTTLKELALVLNKNRAIKSLEIELCGLDGRGGTVINFKNYNSISTLPQDFKKHFQEIPKYLDRNNGLDYDDSSESSSQNNQMVLVRPQQPTQQSHQGYKRFSSIYK